jgi:ketosteroid isomerase-like protein
MMGLQMRQIIKLTLVCFALLSSFASAQSGSEQQVIKVLNSFHQAAASADGDKYFSLLSDDAVFLGTDASERWNKAQFFDYAKPYFSKGKGWTYHPRDRHVAFSASGHVAWFDELLDNDNYGECRGSGVLELIDGEWLISQYNLTIPVPNEMAAEMAEQIRKLKGKDKH